MGSSGFEPCAELPESEEAGQQGRDEMMPADRYGYDFGNAPRFVLDSLRKQALPLGPGSVVEFKQEQTAPPPSHHYFDS